MKKILCYIISAAVAFSVLPTAFAYNDVTVNEQHYMSAKRLSDLEILSGYPDNTFRGDNSITRAEFTKMVVCMMNKEKEAKTGAYISAFPDVVQGSWSAPYINYATKTDILSGYPDGSFGPDNTITYAECLTILLRTLGYTEENVGYFWPNNYINAAVSLGITDGISVGATEPITRKTAAILTDRAMFSRAASGANTYLSTVGYTVLEDALILDNDTKSDNVSVLSGNLNTGNAQTYIKTTAMDIADGDMYQYAVIDKDGYLATVREYLAESSLAKEFGTVNRVSANTIEYTTAHGLKNSFRPDDNFTTYYDNTKMTFAQAVSKISAGADVTFYGKNHGLWNIAVIGTSNDITPVLAMSDCSSATTSVGGLDINHQNLTVYRDGKGATLSDICANDVIYYNTKTNTMDVYAKKVTGTYYAAYPSKAYVESVSVNGKTYSISNQAATNKLDASAGAFEIGDKVTLLLGKNDEVCFVTDNLSGFDYSIYGIVTATGQRIASEGENEGNSEYYAKIFMTDGDTYDIVTDTDYKNSIGKLVKISYNNKTARLVNVVTNNASKYAGNIDVTKRTINGKYFLKDAVIIQNNADASQNVPECEIIDFDKLISNKLDEGHIINAVSANGFGDIAIIYVKNLESSYDYGVITGFEKSNGEITGYKIFADGTAGSYMLGGTISATATAVGKAVGFRKSGQGYSVMTLAELDYANKIGAVEGGRIMLGGDIYEMAGDVEVVDITTLGKYKKLTVDELSRLNITGVTIYSDKSLSQGGIVRVVTVKIGK